MGIFRQRGSLEGNKKNIKIVLADVEGKITKRYIPNISPTRPDASSSQETSYLRALSGKELEVFRIMAYTGRLCQKGAPFSGFTKGVRIS